MKIRNVSLGFFKSYTNSFNYDIFDSAGSGIAQAIGSVASGIMSSRSAAKDRKLQKYMFDTDLAWQREQYDRTEQYNWDMFNAQNEYNDPSAQVQRYLNAGLNPANIMSNSGQNMSASGGSLPSGSSVPLPSLQPYDYSWLKDMFSSLGDIPEIIQNRKLKDQEILRNDINLKRQDSLLLADLLEKKANAHSAESKAVYQDLINDLEDKTKDYKYKEIVESAKQAQERTLEIQANRIAAQATAKMSQLRGDAFPAFLDQELKNLIAEYDVRKSQVILNKEQAKAAAASASLAVAQRFFVEAQKHSIDFDNHMRDSLRKELYDEMYHEYITTRKEQSARYSVADFVDNHPALNTILHGTAGILGGAGALAGGLGSLGKLFFKFSK